MHRFHIRPADRQVCRAGLIATLTSAASASLFLGSMVLLDAGGFGTLVLRHGNSDTVLQALAFVVSIGFIGLVTGISMRGNEKSVDAGPKS